MCRPNYSQYLIKAANERIVLRLPGEGQHRQIFDAFTDKSIKKKNDLLPLIIPDGKTVKRICISQEKLLPFECIWFKDPLIRFQPKGDEFLSYDELPTKQDFDFAQKILDNDIGTIDRLFHWLEISAALAKELPVWDKYRWLYDFFEYPPPYSIGMALAQLTGRNYGEDRQKKKLNRINNILDFYFKRARKNKDCLPVLWRDRL